MPDENMEGLDAAALRTTDDLGHRANAPALIYEHRQQPHDVQHFRSRRVEVNVIESPRYGDLRQRRCDECDPPNGLRGGHGSHKGRDEVRNRRATMSPRRNCRKSCFFGKGSPGSIQVPEDCIRLLDVKTVRHVRRSDISAASSRRRRPGPGRS